jgi:hypothetical protein
MVFEYTIVGELKMCRCVHHNCFMDDLLVPLPTLDHHPGGIVQDHNPQNTTPDVAHDFGRHDDVLMMVYSGSS